MPVAQVAVKTGASDFCGDDGSVGANPEGIVSDQSRESRRPAVPKPSPS